MLKNFVLISQPMKFSRFSFLMAEVKLYVLGIIEYNSLHRKPIWCQVLVPIQGALTFMSAGIQCLEKLTQRLVSTGVNVFRIIHEFRIFGLTFHRKSASKC